MGKKNVVLCTDKDNLTFKFIKSPHTNETWRNFGKQSILEPSQTLLSLFRGTQAVAWLPRDLKHVLISCVAYTKKFVPHRTVGCI